MGTQVDTITVRFNLMEGAQARETECWRVGEANAPAADDPCFADPAEAERYAFLQSCNRPTAFLGVWYYEGGIELRTGKLPDLTRIYFDSNSFARED